MLINRELEERMQYAQDISSMILALRRKVNIKVRQPLQKIMIPILDSVKAQMSHDHRSYGCASFWTFFLASLGVFAIPMKRQMINVEQLRFPSGIASAETLKVSMLKAKRESKVHALWIAGLVGGCVAWFRDASPKFMAFPAQLPLSRLF